MEHDLKPEHYMSEAFENNGNFGIYPLNRGGYEAYFSPENYNYHYLEKGISKEIKAEVEAKMRRERVEGESEKCGDGEKGRNEEVKSQSTPSPISNAPQNYHLNQAQNKQKQPQNKQKKAANFVPQKKKIDDTQTNFDNKLLSTMKNSGYGMPVIRNIKGK